MYTASTHGIEVTVEPFYLTDQSDPEENRFVWGYRVVIANHSHRIVQLKSRYWHITDALGRIDEVNGPGVVGEQPILNPGDSYEYRSGCPLDTSSGMMRGHYSMLAEDGSLFDVDIPAFSLDRPDVARTLN